MIGYARVSMSDQDNHRQIEALRAFGVAKEDIYTDKASGRNMKRPGWQACWQDLREGDLLVVQAIDRLGRDVSELFRVLRELHEKGANLKVLTMDLDTRSPAGRRPARWRRRSSRTWRRCSGSGRRRSAI